MNEISLTINKYFFRLKRNCIGAIIFAMKLYLTEKALAEIKTDGRTDRQIYGRLTYKQNNVLLFSFVEAYKVTEKYEFITFSSFQFIFFCYQQNVATCK